MYEKKFRWVACEVYDKIYGYEKVITLDVKSKSLLGTKFSLPDGTIFKVYSVREEDEYKIYGTRTIVDYKFQRWLNYRFEDEVAAMYTVKVASNIYFVLSESYSSFDDELIFLISEMEDML